jgi:hypothetical protein
MTRRKGLVLDANISLACGLGQRVRELRFWQFAGDPRGGYTVAGSVVSVVENATE